MATLALNKWPFGTVEWPHTFFSPTLGFASGLSCKASVEMSFATLGCEVFHLPLELEIRAI